MKELARRASQLYIIAKYYLVLAIVLLFKIKKSTWLISERGDEARDNGFFFYKYIKDNHPTVPIKFVIKSNSADAKKIDKQDRIEYRSIKHFVYYISSRYLISTHIQGCSPEFRSFAKLAKYHLIYTRGKHIFLQHGIIKDYMKALTRKEAKLDLFICGAREEYNYVKTSFGHENKVIKCTGLARYDTLRKSKKNKRILLMPTWRTYLYKISEKQFIKTKYFREYNNLINNPQLINYLEDKGIEMIFYPHYEVQKFINNFSAKSKKVIIADLNNYDVQDLLNGTSMLITDYSSVFFDYGYIKKPIIYFQFDYEEYRSSHYHEGYFSYKENGFGPICSNVQQVVNNIIKIAENNFTISEEYLNRIDKTFAFNDTKNCERIYKEIKKL